MSTEHPISEVRIIKNYLSNRGWKEDELRRPIKLINNRWNQKRKRYLTMQLMEHWLQLIERLNEEMKKQ